MRAIETPRVPLDPVHQAELEKMLGSNAFSLLKEIISAHCIEAVAAYSDASLYDNPGASDAVAQEKAKAIRYNTAYEVLDLIHSSKDEWYRVNLEPRR